MDNGCPDKIAAETSIIAERYTPQAGNCYEMDQRYPMSNPEPPPTREYKPPQRAMTHEKASDLIGQKVNPKGLTSKKKR